MADKNPPTFDELYAAQIAEKTAAGLTAKQAVDVIRAQIAWDAQQEKDAADKAAAEEKAAKLGKSAK